jgi:hypothetical protein
MKDRFDLENEISILHTFADNLGTLSEGILEHGLTTDETVNAIEGLRVMLSLQANKLMDTMSQCFKLDQYRDCDYTDQDAKMDTYS